MRTTRQKKLIFEIVNNSCDHLTAYQVYEISRKEITNISLGTVYRNLSSLVEESKIKKIEISGTVRFDRNDNHAHFICNKCGNVIDIFDSVLRNNKYINGNLVMNYEIKLKGICKKCIEGNGN